MVVRTYTTTPLFTVIMVPRRKSSDAGSASKPKRSHDVLSMSEKVKILDMIEIKKNVVCGDCQVLWQERIFHSRVMKNKEKIRASFSIALQSAKVTAIAPDKVLMKVEKALNFYNHKSSK